MATTSNVPRTVDAPSDQWSADTYPVYDGDNPIQVAAADPQRRSVTTFNDANSTGVLYVTPSSGSKKGGIRLVPGAGYEFKTAAPIYARAEGGACVVNVVTESGWSC